MGLMLLLENDMGRYRGTNLKQDGSPTKSEYLTLVFPQAHRPSMEAEIQIGKTVEESTNPEDNYRVFVFFPLRLLLYYELETNVLHHHHPL